MTYCMFVQQGERNSIITDDPLIDFDVPEDAPNKYFWSNGGNKTTEQRYNKHEYHLILSPFQNTHCLDEESHSLDPAAHVRLDDIEIYGIQEEVDADGHTTTEGRPSPVVVLRIEEKVRADDGDANLDNDQNG